MIGDQPDDTDVEFIKSPVQPYKIIFKVGKMGTMVGLVNP